MQPPQSQRLTLTAALAGISAELALGRQWQPKQHRTISARVPLYVRIYSSSSMLQQKRSSQIAGTSMGTEHTIIAAANCSRNSVHITHMS
jgi:hypothetical protein